MNLQQTVENLDFYCVDYARRIVDNLRAKERLSGDDISHSVSKFLNILHVNGLYAYLLYVLWKRYNGTPAERKIAAKLDTMLVGEPGEHSLLRLEAIGLPLEKAEDTIAAGRELARDLPNLFLAKELLTRTLTYVRLHARGVA
ncbi:MAG: hypothetical protein DRI79_04795 [Chloroflexi bacterium]|nr:MAG: hypothetical protein DRI80_13630 [Chloroflexota bacterium]RLC90563.1 MAG: hypothetical protein DRI79_04795 [Chloroflexota bacterium]